MAPKTQQAALQPEMIGDVDQGFVPEPEEHDVDELGLTAEERAEFDSMRDADSGLPEPSEEPESEPAGTEPRPQLDAPPAPAPGKKPPPAPVPEEDDEPDLVTRDPRTGKEQRTISFGKHQRLLKREREAAEALRTQAEETRIQQAKLAERLAILNEALNAPPVQQPMTPQEQEYARQQAIMQNPMLEETIDPAIDLPASIAQLQRRQVFMANASMQQQEDTQDQLADQALLRDFTRDTQMFSQTQEGQHFFGGEGAYQFLKNSRLVELGISLFDKDPTDPNEVFSQAEINKMITDFNAEEKWVVNNALQTGKSPAKAIMRLAKGRGWKPPQPAAAAPAPQPGAAAPQMRRAAPAPPLARMPAAAPGAAAPAMRSAVAQLQAEQAGAAASRSLSDGGGAPPAEPLSIEQLLKMDDTEFGIYIDNLPKQRLESLMGREFPGR
jgi:hypothetical protein